MLCKVAVPAELARRPRVFNTGEEFDSVLVGTGDEEVSVKLIRRGSLSPAALNSPGIEPRFSSRVEAGDVERGESRNDMETARLTDGRREADEVCKEIGD